MVLKNGFWSVTGHSHNYTHRFCVHSKYLAPPIVDYSLVEEERAGYSKIFFWIFEPRNMAPLEDVPFCYMGNIQEGLHKAEILKLVRLSVQQESRNCDFMERRGDIPYDHRSPFAELEG